MVSLNLKHINSNSSHTVTAFRDSMCFRFIADFSVIYYVSFPEDESMFNDEPYQFTIANANNRKSPRDSKLRRAVMATAYESFRCSNTTLLYICEAGDSKQSMHNRLFEFWFHFSPRKSDLASMSTDIRNAGGVQNYAAIIIRPDNPNLKSIIMEFTEIVQMLSQKPE